MRLPIRGIQVLLIGAFFAHLIGWMFSTVATLRDASVLQYTESFNLSFWGRQLYDLAYPVFYLGEAAIIELLMRIWMHFRSEN
ncbi:MAG: hypothetical protein AAFX54_09575 [Pseudomonadota bacterium]